MARQLPTIERLIGPERCFVTSPGRGGAVDDGGVLSVLEVDAAEHVDEDRDIVVAGNDREYEVALTPEHRSVGS